MMISFYRLFMQHKIRKVTELPDNTQSYGTQVSIDSKRQQRINASVCTETSDPKCLEPSFQNKVFFSCRGRVILPAFNM